MSCAARIALESIGSHAARASIASRFASKNLVGTFHGFTVEHASFDCALAQPPPLIPRSCERKIGENAAHFFFPSRATRNWCCNAALM